MSRCRSCPASAPPVWRCVLLTAVLGLAGCAGMDERPEATPDVVVPELLPAEIARAGGDAVRERYPWCDAEPLGKPDPDFVRAMQRQGRELRVPEDRLAAGGLRILPQADPLYPIEIDPDRGVLALSEPASMAWLLMQATARADGVTLIPLSAYRSPAYQRRILRQRLAAGEDIDEILDTSLPPGYSQHQTGDAIDIGSPAVPEVDPEFAGTRAFAWLEDHAPAFCFELSYPEDNDAGIEFEPWHWHYVRGTPD